jgi:radical SAM protein (TIGR01212 family)
LINRGHDYACFERAVEMTSVHGILTCAHVILGFPNESDEKILQTADCLAKLPIDFLKIHDLHIVRGTAMARDYEHSSFPLRSCAEYIDLICRFLERIPSHVAIQRFFSHTPPELLIAPHWNMNSQQRLQLIRDELERRNTWQGRLCS